MTVAAAPGPFVGLRPFEGRDHHLFFGRETHVDRLLMRLRDQRFLAVVGISGSGKSSLVRAGLLPRLERSFIVGGRCCWRFAMLRPGSDPVGALAEALRDAGPQADPDGEDWDPEALDAGSSASERVEREHHPIEFVRGSLLRSSLALVDYVRAMGLDEDENLLIVVDQFEELFRYRPLATERDQDRTAHFISLLLEAAARSDVPVFVVVTMRSDFLGDCARFPMLAEAINRGQYLVSFLTRRHREEAIVKPLRAFDLLIEPKLLHRLHDDTRSRDDQLPVLQHALMRTHRLWRARTSGQQGADTITYSDYEAAGGMAKAMSDHANEAMREIEAADLRTVQLLFRALTERREDGRAVRRPCRVSEVMEVSGAPLARIEAIVGAFQERDQRHFIVVRPRGPLTPQSELDLAHESLMRVWDLYVKWTKREVADAGQLRRLQELKERYDKGEAGLLRDPELGVVLEWAAKAQPSEAWARRYKVDLAAVSTYVEASRAAEAEREEAKQREIRAERERQRRRVREWRRNFTIAAVLAFLALAGLVFGIYGGWVALDYKQRVTKALEDADEAEARAKKKQQEADDANVAAEEAEKRTTQAKEELANVSTRLAELQTDLRTKEADLKSAKIDAEAAKKRQTEAEAAKEAADKAKKKADQERNGAVSDKEEAERLQEEADAAAEEAKNATLTAQGKLAAVEKKYRESLKELDEILPLLNLAKEELSERRRLERWRKEFGNVPRPGGVQ